MTCERCGATTPPSPGPSILFDFCLVCSKNLCAGCMADGCCGHVPAKSGNATEYPEPEEDPCPNP
jgi:hypothetical protein